MAHTHPEPSHVSDDHLSTIWRYNRKVPQEYHLCLHDLVADRAQAFPESPAVCAWDGSLTYRRLDQLSSALATHLVSTTALKPQSVVLLTFERSMWASVSALAVSKASCAFVLVDMDLPADRIEQIAVQADASFAITSPKHAQVAARLVETVVTVCEDADLWGTDSHALQPSPSVVSPSSVLYIVFTSGSTGKPKAVQIRHSNIISSVFHHASIYRLDSTSRYLDWASYSFDAALHHLIASFVCGACLCIPSADDRNFNLSHAIDQMQVTHANMTPSASRLLTPGLNSSLKYLTLAGEPCKVELARRWANYVQVMNAYGPSECAINSTTHLFDPQNDFGPTVPIGRGLGVVTWLVNAHNTDELAPIGDVGELWLEGPIVGAGYLADPEKTAAAFPTDPKWLLAGHGPIPGRRGRLYRTGDLCRYLPSGELLFCGRRDSQIKLRGQRIEIGEVEAAIEAALPGATALVDIIQVQSSSHLAACICTDSHRAATAAMTENFPAAEDGREGEIKLRLQEKLPQFMVPTFIRFVQSFPTTASGKVDRRTALADLLDSVSTGTGNNNDNTAQSRALTQLEEAIRQKWATNLNREHHTIQANSNYFGLGGDSVSAMKLVALLRSSGYSLSMQDIFRHPLLCEMTTACESDASRTLRAEVEPPVPLELLPSSARRDALDEAASSLGLPASSIEDIYPATALQESLIALSSQRPGSYITRTVTEIRRDLSLQQARDAWHKVFMETTILRTRLIHLPSCGLVQIVVKDFTDFVIATSLEATPPAVMHTDRKSGAELAKMSFVIPEGEDGPRLAILHAHHAVMDGWVCQLVMGRVNAIADQLSPIAPAGPPFSAFIRDMLNTDEEGQSRFWRNQFAGASPSIFPTSSRANAWATKVMTSNIQLDDAKLRSSHYTLTTHFRLAWAMVCGYRSNSHDVVFGVTVTGRNSASSDIHNLIAPTIATVPVRVAFTAETPLQSALKAVHDQSAAMIPYEQVGLHKLQKSSLEARHASQFQTLVVIQPETPEPSSNAAFRRQAVSADYLLDYSSYPLVIDCSSNAALLSVAFAYDDKTLSETEMTWIAEELKHALLATYDESIVSLGDILGMPPNETQQVAKWNPPQVPSTCKACLHELITARAAENPLDEAVFSWDATLTYAQLHDLSDRLANLLQQRGIRSEVIVPMLFDKSSLTVVTILAVLKSGGACLTLDPRQPMARLLDIVERTGASLILASAENADLLQIEGVERIIVTHQLLSDLESNSLSAFQASADPDSAAFIVFTSGSTGKPKGITLQHRAICSTTRHHCGPMRISADTRMLQYSSPSFDNSIYEIMLTLVAGGCLCVPSEHERYNAPGQFARQARATHLLISPTAIRAMKPEDAPSLSTVVLVGEALPLDVVKEWQKSTVVMNGYGPGEGTFCSTIPIDLASRPVSTLGFAKGCMYWLCVPNDPSRLAPVGSIGEIIIGGPTLARGYLKDPQKTEAVFLKDLPWMSSFNLDPSTRVYKSGDLGRYNADGSIDYAGRVDTQVKLRGQRIELGEVELNLLEILRQRRIARDVIADLITPRGGAPTLVAFVDLADAPKENDDVLLDHSYRISESEGIKQELGQHLPGYMCPSVLLPLARIPQTSSGKTDRKLLREIGNGLDHLSILSYQSSKTRRMTKSTQEKALSGVWAGLLNIPTTDIAADDSFFHIGGNSIDAMKLVSIARREGRDLSVTSVYKTPTLAQMAVHWAVEATRDFDLDFPPFTLINNGAIKNVLLKTLCQTNGIASSNVKDIYPATYDQSVELRSGHSLTARFSMGDQQSVTRAITAWQKIVDNLDILRTVLVSERTRMYAIVLKSVAVNATRISESAANDAENLRKLVSFREGSLLLGISYTCTEIILSINHAIYDGYSLSKLWEDFKAAYETGQTPQRYPYQNILYTRSGHAKDPAQKYWTELLRGSKQTHLPECEDNDSASADARSFTRKLDGIRPPRGLVLDALLKTAWASALHHELDCDDVVFCQVINGRRLGGSHIENSVGPLLQLVPVRASKLNEADKSARTVAQQLQEQDAEGVPHEFLTDLEIWECAGWGEEELAGSIFDHIHSDVAESEITLDGRIVGPKVEHIEGEQEELSLVNITTGDSIDITMLVPSGCDGTVAKKVFDRYCSAVRAFSDDADVHV